jgi:rSAM/selenodomain-associated transferase 1
MVPEQLKKVDWLVLTKAPVPGTVKTRLIPHLGEQQATDLYLSLLRRLYNTLCELKQRDIGSTSLWISGDQKHPAFEPWQEIADFHTQPEGDLGIKMAAAVQASLQQDRLPILIGVDVPMLDVEYLSKAAQALLEHDLVISPAEDGGYGLLGMKQCHPQLFENKVWGTDSVLADTYADLATFKQQGFNWAELPTVWDVDEVADVERYLEC